MVNIRVLMVLEALELRHAATKDLPSSIFLRTGALPP